MKKLIIVFASLLVICFTLYFAFFTNSKASNNFHKFEYYYNNDPLDEDNNSMAAYNKDASTSTEDKMNIKITLPTEIDTEPNSITVLINKEYTLPSDYVPDNLVVPDILFQSEYFEEKKLMREDVAAALEDLFAAASKDNLTLYGVSGYRSYKRQEEIYKKNIRTKGYKYTSQISAKPGSSEHQSGLAIDVSALSVKNNLIEAFADTAEGRWLAKNAHTYGFIIRYPKDKSDVTGYSYEPWHIRYVGIDIATYLYYNNLTLEEYYNYTPSATFMEDEYYGTVIDIEESSTPSPTPSPTVSVSPSPTPEPKEEDVSPSPDPEDATPTTSPLDTEDPVSPSPLPTESPYPAQSMDPVTSTIPDPSASPVVTDFPSAEESSTPITTE